jgi:DNA-binding response OmpR family regulator
MINRERILTKEAIAEHLWEDNIDMTDNFDFIYTHLNNIRRKIRAAGGTDYIKTIYGSGYKFTGR